MMNDKYDALMKDIEIVLGRMPDNNSEIINAVVFVDKLKQLDRDEYQTWYEFLEEMLDNA